MTHNGVSGRHPLIEILSARHRHQLMSILGAWHTRVRSFGSDSRCALVTARVRAAGREFRRSFLAPAMIPQSPDVHRENGLGRLARIGCSRPATLLNLMPIFFRFRVLESEPPTSSRIVWLGIFCECRAKFGSFVSLLALESGGWELLRIGPF